MPVRVKHGQHEDCVHGVTAIGRGRTPTAMNIAKAKALMKVKEVKKERGRTMLKVTKSMKTMKALSRGYCINEPPSGLSRGSARKLQGYCL